MTNSTHTVEETVALEPCPFCGAPGEIVETEASQAAGPGNVYRGNCSQYGCADMVWTSVRREAVEAWNTRADVASHSTPAGEDGIAKAREYLLLASYCGDDNEGCSDARPCSECLAMCNVFDPDGLYLRQLGEAEAAAEPTTAFGISKRRYEEKIARRSLPNTDAHDELVEALDSVLATSGARGLYDARKYADAVQRAEALLTKMGEKL